MTQALLPGKKRIITTYRVVVSSLLALAAAIFYVGLISSVDKKTDEERDQRVVQVLPAPDEFALRQDRIYVKFDPDYTGVLLVDGVEIPEDQIDRDEGLDTAAFTPGEGKEISELTPGERCATAVYWPTSSSRELSAESYSWCWNVH